MIRKLYLVALALTLVIIGASAYLRLAGNGLGCEPWPICYGRIAVEPTAMMTAARWAHRTASVVFSVLVLALLVRGWRGGSVRERTAAVLLALVTLALAVVGRFAPSQLPLIPLANVLGGFALLALLAYLLSAWRASPDEIHPPHHGRVAVAIVLMLLALQSALGVLISARLAGAACSPRCDVAWLPGALQLLNPMVQGSAVDILRRDLGGQPLQAWHRLIGIVLALVAAGVALASTRRFGTAHVRWVVGAALATAALGFAVVGYDAPLAAVVAHALAAATLIAACAALLERTPRARPDP